MSRADAPKAFRAQPSAFRHQTERPGPGTIPTLEVGPAATGGGGLADGGPPSRPFTSLRRTTAYITAHLVQELSLATLAAVAQTNMAHFVRLFKHATGLAPHQYVIRYRMAHAKRLLAETDVPLIEIGLQVGCADQSHCTALFRTHVALTPRAYRAHTRSA